MNNCGKCEYFGKVITQFDDDNEEYNTVYHTCRKIEHMDCLPNTGNALAGVIDGSDYFAALIVASDFGCVNFKEKE